MLWVEISISEDKIIALADLKMAQYDVVQASRMQVLGMEDICQEYLVYLHMGR